MLIGFDAVGLCSVRTHVLHAGALSPRKMSLAVIGDMSLQKGQCEMICSQSSLQPHFLAVLATHAQQMGWVQHLSVVEVLQQALAWQNACAQM